MSENRVVVITGAARGIGRATAVAFARAGYRVAGADIAALASSAMDYEPATADDLAETGRLVQEAGAEWLPVVFDQRDKDAVRDGFAQVVEHFGGVDVVFANAGVQGFASLLDMSDELWNDQARGPLRPDHPLPRPRTHRRPAEGRGDRRRRTAQEAAARCALGRARGRRAAGGVPRL